MKRSLLWLLLVVGSISCKKNKDTSLNDLAGTWEYQKSDGACTTLGWTPVTTTYHFLDNNYAWYEGGKLIRNGIFSIEPNVKDPAGKTCSKLIFDNRPDSAAAYYEWKGNELVIRQFGLSCGVDRYFKRVN
ncbi:hypothetical protein [Chitinophaga qingshengii]|uniref:Lipocalin-like domain-containing protein n=1 Tax=Chitinophaga qingshengii TaxID=1569794 RepID=A0ABR7TPW9_9BACT|nr:hypothetical protein [Chitinophaga qingshengii]MBC9931484.1 hypothetical protein [Chitinophaga qingshengii]